MRGPLASADARAANAATHTAADGVPECVCLGCHRLDGAGVPPEVPSLLGLIGAILATAAGRDYIARVPEVAQSPRDDAALTRLLDRVLQESSAETLPVGSRAPGPAEVGAARTGVLADPLRTRAAIAGQTAPHGDSAQ